MSDLLNQASLVMVPSGYKEDTVYSVVPSNGNGDLSFTRASNGTRINSAGLVEVCPWNLVQQSETFDNAFWAKFQASITANDTIAPNGTTTADKVIASTNGAAVVYISDSTYISGVYNWSVYAKAGNQNKVYLEAYGVGGTACSTNINLTTQTIISQTNFTNLTIESVGNDWYKISATFSNLGGSIVTIGFGMASSVSTNDFAYFWGAQLNIGSTAKPYFPTTDRLNVPRLTYQNGGGGCPSLLLEKQSTNLITYSEDFSNSDWQKQNTSVTANATTSPDGTQNADKLIANTSNARHLIYQAYYVTNTHTFTTYAKAGENSFLIMRLDTDSPEVKTWFNLSNGTIGVSQGGSPTITSIGNGWYRCSVTYVSSTTQTLYAVLYTAKTDGGEGFEGNNSDGTFLWGAQLEASSYPTSYIPTTSSSATRVVDGGYKFGISSLIGQSEGTIFLNYTLLNNSTDDITIGITGNNGKIIWFRKNGIQFYGNGTTLLFDASSTGTMGVTYKMAFVYGQSDFRLYINGSLIGSVTSGTFTGTFDDFTFFPVGGTPYTNANKIKEMVFFKTKLTNAELAQLTA